LGVQSVRIVKLFKVGQLTIETKRRSDVKRIKEVVFFVEHWYKVLTPGEKARA